MTAAFEEELSEVVRDDDTFRLVVRGQALIEGRVTRLLSENLTTDHSVELERLSYPLRVDLAIGQRLLLATVRPLLLKLNSLRNKFAHSYTHSFDETSAGELWNTLDEPGRSHRPLPDTPHKTARYCIVVAAFEVHDAFQRPIRRKVNSEVWLEQVADFLERIGVDPEDRDSGLHREPEWLAKVEERLKERYPDDA